MTISKTEIAAIRSKIMSHQDLSPADRRDLMNLADTALDLSDAVDARNRVLRDGGQLPDPAVAAAIAETKLFFLMKAREHESGDLAEEWMKALRMVCECEQVQAGRIEILARARAELAKS